MSATAYRFETRDEDAIRDRIAATLNQWRADGLRTFDGTALLALERVGAHAIGCGLHDLRDCERQWIVDQIGQLTNA